ncbi:hypothetical protein QAD02_012408 [Eretmocerus hayati]|uniref:Uncharacterized protein n=1 Tax=Eretmocerus hayati TaxID=131215 RepID=A0ACC2P0M4_9HYME|nr:hypothetical protein QAD02_012408 [Eretmocerus hayati]
MIILLKTELIQRLESERKARPRRFRQPSPIRHFVLISSISTWSRSRPDTSGEPLTEADYRKRRSHEAFKRKLECERAVLSMTSARKHSELARKLQAIVLCAGLTYGDEEGLLEPLFKLAWLNEKQLPVIEPGDNLVPLLHVRDLAAAVYAIMDDWPKIRYIVAVEKEVSKQKSIVKAISRVLSTGNLKFVSEEEAVFQFEIPEVVLNAMTLNTNISPAHLINNSRMNWQSERCFCKNISAIVEEYRISRNLLPIRVIILGPPASGKTTLAKALCQHYKLHYVSEKTLVAETISQIFRRKLLSKGCRNQGYVMDGYPETLSQAGLLFNSIESKSDVEDYEGEDNSVTDGGTNELESLEPEFVIALEASDDFLMERVISLPERDLQDSRRVEEQMLQRFRDYKERNDEDVTPLQVFDELEVHPNIINIEGDKFPQMTKTFEHCLSIIGEARNYGPTPEEIEEETKRIETKAAAEAARKKAEQEQEIIKRIHEREKRALEWMELLDKLKEEEEERLCLMAEPLRHYLARYVFPTLTQGLSEVAKVRPDEPIDYLAEYFLKKNPEGRLFEPDNNEKMSSILDSIHRLQSDGSLPLCSEEDAFEHVNIVELSSTSDEVECCYCSSSSDSIDRVSQNMSNESGSKQSCK